MAIAKIDCPECGATLKPAKPLTPGKKVRCPKCDNVFTVPGAEDEDEEAPAGKTKAGAGKGGRKSAPAEDAPPPPPRVSDDEEGGIYGLAKGSEEEEEEEESKPKVNYAPDLSVKDPRGPATAILAVPTNGILGFGALLSFLSVVCLCIAIWPFLFTKWNSGVTPYQAKKEYEKRNPKKDQKNAPKKEEDSFPDQDLIAAEMEKKGNEKMRALWEEMVEDDQTMRIIQACCSGAGIIYFFIMAFAGVKTQNIESYRWAMTASIMAMGSFLLACLGGWGVTLTSDNHFAFAIGLGFVSFVALAVSLFGLWTMFLLRNPNIQEAFEYDPEKYAVEEKAEEEEEEEVRPKKKKKRV